MLSKVKLNNAVFSGDTNCLVIKWDSMHNLMDDLISNQSKLGEHKNSLSPGYRDSFTTDGISSEKCLKYLDEGDLPDNMFFTLNALLQSLDSDIEFKKIAKKLLTKRTRHFQEEGDELCIDKLMSGDMAHWQKTESKPDKPVYKILINGSSSARVRANTFLKLAVAATGISYLLALSGKNVEIDLYYGGRNTTDVVSHVHTFITLKRSSEPLDIKKVSAHALSYVLRGLIFNVYDGVLPGEPHWGLGSPIKAKSEIINNVEYDYIIQTGDLEECKPEEYIKKVFKNEA